MKILVLDNYDSFVYNLVHLIRELGFEPDIIRNDKITLEEVQKYDKILLSPGPGIPQEAGIMPQLIKEYAPTKSILGVCLGHQAIGEAFGASLFNLPVVLHGIQDEMTVNDIVEMPLFKDLPTHIQVAHYHSWVVDVESLKGTPLVPAAYDDQGLLMAVKHEKYDVQGVQFHPESVLTEYGKEMIANWLKN